MIFQTLFVFIQFVLKTDQNSWTAGGGHLIFLAQYSNCEDSAVTRPSIIPHYSPLHFSFWRAKHRRVSALLGLCKLLVFAAIKHVGIIPLFGGQQTRRSEELDARKASGVCWRMRKASDVCKCRITWGTADARRSGALGARKASCPSETQGSGKES